METNLEQYRERVKKVVMRRGVWAQDADDIVQEAMLRAHRNRHTLRHDSDPLPWLCRIATRLVMDQKRLASRRPQYAEPEVYNPEWRADTAPLADALVCAESVVNDVKALLNVDDYTLVRMKAEGYSEKEIGRLLHCAQGTIRSRFHRIRNRLTKELAVAA